MAAVNGGVESSVTVEPVAVSTEKVEKYVQSENVTSVESVEETVAIESVAESFADVGVFSDSISVSADGCDDQHVGQNLR